MESRQREFAGSTFDFIMDSRLKYCLSIGLSLYLDVYAAAGWLNLTELTEINCPEWKLSGGNTRFYKG